MPIIKSAKKRVRVARKATIRNSKTKRSLRTAIKAFYTAVTGGDSKATTATVSVAAAQSEAQSNLDKAAKKGIIHKNKASRQKSQLAARAKAAGTAAPVKVAKAAATKAKKPATPRATKPTVAKKAVAAKPTAVAKTAKKKTI